MNADELKEWIKEKGFILLMIKTLKEKHRAGIIFPGFKSEGYFLNTNQEFDSEKEAIDALAYIVGIIRSRKHAKR